MLTKTQPNPWVGCWVFVGELGLCGGFWHEFEVDTRTDRIVRAETIPIHFVIVSHRMLAVGTMIYMEILVTEAL